MNFIRMGGKASCFEYYLVRQNRHMIEVTLKQRKSKNHKSSMIKRLLIGMVLFIQSSVISASGLFGYQENQRSNLQMFPQWLSVLERALKERVPDGNCDSRVLDQCHLKQWQQFLNGIKKLSRWEQLERVNQFANEHDYIIDIENYGVEDYWATPGEFLLNHGDCEDYAITKMLSLKMLGFNMEAIRLVVLQDTNLGVAHAVLALDSKNDTLILDNQIDEIVSHKHVLHYVPVYALNEKGWWMFLPK